MERFKVAIRVKGTGPDPDSLETTATVLASDVMAALRPFRDAAAKMAPKERERTDEN